MKLDRWMGLLAGLVVLAGCTSNTQPEEQEPTDVQVETTTEAETLTFTVGAVPPTDFDVICSTAGDTVVASGAVGGRTVNLTVEGPAQGIVYTSVAGDGATELYEARTGLTDNSGEEVGKVTIQQSGKSYDGTAVFVIIATDSAGTRTNAEGDNTAEGSFELTCGKAT